MTGKCLGVDFGQRRIGIAVSDALGMVATPHSVIQVEKPGKAVQDVADLARELGVARIVVGLPLHMDGGKGELAELAEAFMDKLRGCAAAPVEAWDERLTSRQAENVLIEAGTRRDKRKQVIDKLAAQLLLQSYLDANAEF